MGGLAASNWFVLAIDCTMVLCSVIPCSKRLTIEKPYIRNTHINFANFPMPRLMTHEVTHILVILLRPVLVRTFKILFHSRVHSESIENITNKFISKLLSECDCELHYYIWLQHSSYQMGSQHARVFVSLSRSASLSYEYTLSLEKTVWVISRVCKHTNMRQTRNHINTSYR